MILSILGFISILGPLVVFHELGHFFFARLFGVKAEVFSVGFGKVLWSKQVGETNWRLSLVPLGGFVKLLGEEPGVELPPELQARSLQRQEPWKRFLIFFGGPLFNFILAAVVYMAIQVIGEQHVTSRIGRVLPESQAAVAGLRSGDRILEVAGKPVTKFEEIDQALIGHAGMEVELKVERTPGVAPLSVRMLAASQSGYSEFGEKKQVGEIPGLLPAARDRVVGVSDPTSPAGRAGIRTGDRVISWSGKPVANFEEVERYFAEAALGESIRIETESDRGKLGVDFVKRDAASRLADLTGIHSSELFVEKAVPKSPAEEVGLRQGDRIVSVDGVSVQSFFQLRELVQKAGEKAGKLVLGFEREGKLESKELIPAVSSSRDAELAKTRQFTIGVFPMLSWAQPEFLIERTFNPIIVLARGVSKMVELSWRNIVSIGKMIVGDVSVRTLGGPLLIGKIAGESLSRGLITFLSTMALLSIGLGVLNLLPVPVLDGGHILLLGLEVLRGKPLQMKQLEIIQQVGLAFILILMLVVMRNDITRLF